MNDMSLPRKMWRTLEPYHAVVYFAPQPRARYDALGLGRAMGYFASRAAAMGAVRAEVVIATFYNFSPELVRRCIPEAWRRADPGDILAARYDGMDELLREVLGDEIGSPEMREAAGLARVAALACRPEGRPLHAAHAGLPWPGEPHLTLWHAITVLREHRGDGHLTALMGEGLDGAEALVSYAASGEVPADLLQATRGWDQDGWQGACERLRERGLMDGGGGLTGAGREMRDRIEARTDALAADPWLSLGEDACDRLRSLVRPWSKALVASGSFGT